MNRLNQILALVLSIQLLIAGGLYLATQPMATSQVQTALLQTSRDQIDRITIETNDSQPLVVTKINGNWQLPDYHRLPANRGQIDSALGALETTKSGWPVATTASGRTRFEVAPDKYQKKVVLSQGDVTLQTLYLGTSPGYRQLHVRRDGEDEVYAATLNSFDFPLEHDAWLDSNLLQPDTEINSLKGADFALEKQNDEWRPVEGEGKAINEEIAKITDTLRRIKVQSAIEKPDLNANYELTIKTVDKEYTYRFYQDGDKHYLERNDYAQLFNINKSDYDKLSGLSAIQLVSNTSSDAQNSAVEAISGDS